jgi:hypothetical protein
MTSCSAQINWAFRRMTFFTTWINQYSENFLSRSKLVSCLLIISSRHNFTRHREHLIQKKLLTARYQIILKSLVIDTVTD